MKLLQSVLLLTGFLWWQFPKLPHAGVKRRYRGSKKTRTRGVWLFLAAVIWVITEQLL